MSVVDMSPHHKIHALEMRIKVMMRNANEREAEIAKQAQTIASLFVILRRLDELVGEGMTRCAGSPQFSELQDHQIERPGDPNNVA
jgi:hypothetical protein